MKVLAITNMYPTAAYPGRGTFVEQQIQGLRSVGVDVEILHIRRVESGRKAYATAFYRIRSELRSTRADVIHVMCGGFLAAFTAANAQSPFVISFCGSDLLGEPLAGRTGRAIGALVVSASQWSAQRAHGIIVKSANLVRALPGNIDRRRIWIVPNGIDLNRFRPLDRKHCRRELGWSEDSFQVLIADSASSPTKRIDLAQSAVAELRASGIRAELQAMRRVPHHDVPRWLNAADVLVLCSAHEGSPNIVKEALACNLPIVSTDVGDVRERIEEVAGCFLADPTPYSLASQLEAVFRGPRVTRGRLAVAHLSTAQIAEHLVRIYGEVLGASTAADQQCRVF